MYKIKFFLVYIVLLTGCKSSQLKVNQYNVILKDDLKNVIEQYLKFDENNYLNYLEHYLVLDIQKSHNRIRLTNQIIYPFPPNNEYFGIAYYKNFKILLYGDIVDELFILDKSISLVKENNVDELVLDYNPIVWMIEFDEGYNIVRVSDHLGTKIN